MTVVFQCRCRGCMALFETPAPAPGAPAGFVAAIDALRCPTCGRAGGDLAQRRSLAEDRVLRRTTMKDGVAARAADWLATGEWGRPAKAVHCVMTSAKLPAFAVLLAHPRTPLDLHRCLLLFDRVPEWRDRIGEMGAASASWKIIAANWRHLEIAYAQETGDAFDGVTAPKTEMFLEFLERTATTARAA